jgi:hypothetical protein
MGIICANNKPTGDFEKVPKLKKNPAEAFIKNRGVEIILYQKAADGDSDDELDTEENNIFN